MYECCIIQFIDKTPTIKYHIAGKFGGENVWRIYTFGEKFGEWIHHPKGLLIVTTALDGFSLENHQQFAKFTKLSTVLAAIR